MALDYHPSDEREKRQIQTLKSFANQIEHKFQIRSAYNIDPPFLDQILKELIVLRSLTHRHKLLNKISDLEISITAAIRYYIDNKYEEFFFRVKAIRDKLNGLDE
jgi:hypothetical protein